MAKMNGNQENFLQKATEDLVLIEDDAILSIKEVHEIASDSKIFSKYKSALKDKFYSTLLFALTHEKYTEEKSKDLWDSIVLHRDHLLKVLERDVGISVAALDYMTNIAKKIPSPKILAEEKTHQIAEIATRDELTGLYLRGIFDVFIERYINESVRYDTQLTLMLIDIDDFKKINDTHGHLKGDEVLAQIGKIIADNIRDSDLAARYGGEELAVILPQTNIGGAYKIAERIRKEVFGYFKDDLGVTISIGLSCLEKGTDTSEILIAHADKALYKAKSAGKNRVVQERIKLSQ
jgi:diguanylate cyclase (GGDEF)-like protein